MAIKGKSKPSSKRAVTRGPKPAYVPVSKPLLARRGFQIGLAVVVLAASSFGIWYGFRLQSQREEEQALRAREREALAEYRTVVGRALQGVGQPLGPTQFDVLPALTSTLGGLEKGDVSEEDAASQGRAAAAGAKSAWEAIDAVDLPDLIRNKGFPLALVNYLLNSQDKMVAALKFYEQAGMALEQAAKAPEGERARLLALAQTMLPTASELFNSGYSDLVNAEFSIEQAGAQPGG